MHWPDFESEGFLNTRKWAIAHPMAVMKYTTTTIHDGGRKKNGVFVCRNLLDGSSLHSFFSQERSLNDLEKFPERLVCIL